jgi:hypothetical protein
MSTKPVPGQPVLNAFQIIDRDLVTVSAVVSRHQNGDEEGDEDGREEEEKRPLECSTLSRRDEVRGD